MSPIPSFASRGLNVALVVSLGMLPSVWSLHSHAAQSGAQFNVTVSSSAPAPATTGLCSSKTGVGAFGATVTVVCGTNVVTALEAVATGMPFRPTHGGAYRFLTRLSSDDLSATVDSYTGAGTSTAYRIVNSGNREYIEMTVGW